MKGSPSVEPLERPSYGIPPAFLGDAPEASTHKLRYRLIPYRQVDPPGIVAKVVPYVETVR